MPPFLRQRDALPRAEFERLREKVLASPLIGKSTLAGSFQASRGFAVTFTREALAKVEHRFEFLRPFLALALEPNSGRRLLPPLRRFARWEEPNAFYLNVLIVPSGAAVGRHTDGTLRGPSGIDDALPQQVSVLYLQVPGGLRGGSLRLYRGERRVAELPPRENVLVRFRGDLSHEVAKVETAPESPRASLVLEQYCLPREGLGRLEPLHIQSKAGFDAYLRDERPPPDFEG